MNDSPFGRLPRELRDEIYLLALATSTYRKPIKLEEIIQHNGIACVCRQIRVEAQATFYSQNDFVYEWRSNPNVPNDRFTTLIANFDTDLLASVRSLALTRGWDWVIRSHVAGKTTAKETKRNVREPKGILRPRAEGLVQAYEAHGLVLTYDTIRTVYELRVLKREVFEQQSVPASGGAKVYMDG